MKKPKVVTISFGSVSDSHFFADPDPGNNLHADADPDPGGIWGVKGENIFHV